MQHITKTCIFLLLFSCTNAVAREASISGSVKDKAGAALPMATVSLLKAADSAWLQSTYSADDGRFLFDKVAAGSYIMSVTSVGYETSMSPVIVKDKSVAIDIALLKKSTELKEMTITAKKQFIENGLGKTIVNVDVLIDAAGQSVLDLLRKSPGISVSASGNISMAGKNGVLVMIDDKPTYMSVDQLADYLKGLSSNEVAQLELITQPSSKYDAAGSAGIINIKMKKNRRQGWSGNIDAAYAQATHLNSHDNVHMEYHNKKFGFTANTSISGFKGFQDMTIDRNYRDPVTNEITTKFHQPVSETETFYQLPLRLDADYSITDKDVVGVNLTGVYHPNNEYNNSVAMLTDPQTGISNYNVAKVSNYSLKKDVIANAYYKHIYSKESELNVTVDYANYNSRLYQVELNHNYDAQMQAQPDPLTLRGTLPTYINVYSAKADYNTTLKNKVKIEAGAKASLVTNNNIADYDAYDNGSWMPDTTRSNHFVYNEQISALYVNATKALNKKWQMQLGLRAESTFATGKQSINSQSFSRSFISVFPTGFVTYDADKDNHFEANYGRRIDRPDYQLMNPFRNAISQYNYQVGNPDLLPQFTHNIGLKHSYKNMLTTNISYSVTSDVISSIYSQDASTNVAVVSVDNVATNKTLDVTETFNKELVKGWTVNVYSEYFYNLFTGKVNAQYVHVSGPGSRIGITNDVKFPKNWTAECGVFVGGYMQSDLEVVNGPSVYTSLSVSKKINDDTTIKLAIRDPFKMYNESEIHNGIGVDSRSQSTWDTQEVALIVSWKFGRKQENATKHENMDIDEAKRIKM